MADSLFCDPVLEIPRLGYLCVGRLCVPPPGLGAIFERRGQPTGVEAGDEAAPPPPSRDPLGWNPTANQEVERTGRSEGRVIGPVEPAGLAIASRGFRDRSQLPVKSWHKYIDDPAVADAALDRIAYNAHQITLKGASMRKRRAPP